MLAIKAHEETANRLKELEKDLEGHLQTCIWRAIKQGKYKTTITFDKQYTFFVLGVDKITDIINSLRYTGYNTDVYTDKDKRAVYLTISWEDVC